MALRKVFNSLYKDSAQDPYVGLDPAAYPEDVRGWWSDDPLFGKIITNIQPELIVEVGTWKGASAIHMAGLCAEQNLDTEIVCVDTFCGSALTWIHNPASLQLNHGRSTMNELFMANVMRHGHEHRITPLVATSSVAARVLGILDASPDLIYIDGSHLKRDVLNDLYNYEELAHDRTVILCDDYRHNRIPGVTEAVTEFLQDKKEYALIQIPQSSTATEWIADGDTCMKCAILRKDHPKRFSLHSQLQPPDLDLYFY